MHARSFVHVYHFSNSTVILLSLLKSYLFSNWKKPITMACPIGNSNGEVVDRETATVLESYAKREKLIIDTDPGIGEFLCSFVWLIIQT